MDLIDAIMEHKLDDVKKLLEEGTDPNWTEDAANITPLHYAVVYKFSEAIPLLLKAGADPQRADLDGISPFELAVELGNEAVIELFEKA